MLLRAADAESGNGSARRFTMAAWQAMAMIAVMWRGWTGGAVAWLSGEVGLVFRATSPGSIGCLLCSLRQGEPENSTQSKSQPAVDTSVANLPATEQRDRKPVLCWESARHFRVRRALSPRAAPALASVLVAGRCKIKWFGTPGRTRTHNLLIRSQTLYPLSYEGTSSV